jgi:hypothetical protein
MLVCLDYGQTSELFADMLVEYSILLKIVK